MSIDTNKAVVIASIDEGWNMRRLPILDQLLDPDLVDHSVPSDLPATREGTKTLATRYWRAFPDLRLTIEDQIAEGDKVMSRWTARGTHTGTLMRLLPTGKPVIVTGIRVDRISGDRIVETWAEIDQYGLLRQIGVWDS
jgi:predicted ester cyclase